MLFMPSCLGAEILYEKFFQSRYSQYISGCSTAFSQLQSNLVTCTLDEWTSWLSVSFSRGLRDLLLAIYSP
ncbi:hypothetical protein T4D_7911 [Trichinella pseudospiralis]|uniref:Uncharacterized protein n=1 Tax=Trichinella pseudospiralis TaxID=6337 RepID=A0A0V1G1W1_TRIPS|nr:hypothetical protein T4D_7911 [Trichinella pseudospiralis]